MPRTDVQYPWPYGEDEGYDHASYRLRREAVRQFLVQACAELDGGDLRQPSEKGWGAVALSVAEGMGVTNGTQPPQFPNTYPLQP